MTTSTLSTFLLLALLLHSTNAAVFTVRNNCKYTVWAGAVPGGGKQLNSGQTWTINVPAGTTSARIWPRTNCNFDSSGHGKCETGDCNGLLQCTGYGTAPNTLAEYSLNQPNNLDYYDISLVAGFNVPLSFDPSSGSCTTSRTCPDAAITTQCPSALKAPGGCNNPCTVYKTPEYCCTSGPCNPTPLSEFFKTRCPQAYSYPKDDPTSLVTCPSGTNYDVTFCP